MKQLNNLQEIMSENIDKVLQRYNLLISHFDTKDKKKFKYWLKKLQNLIQLLMKSRKAYFISFTLGA